MSTLRVDAIGKRTGALVDPVAGRASSQVHFRVASNAVTTTVGTNVNLVTRESAGIFRIDWSVAYADDQYFPMFQVYMIDGITTTNVAVHIKDLQPGFCRVTVRNGNGVNLDPTGVIGVVFGDLP